MIAPSHLDVALVAYDRLRTFEFGTAIEIFGLPRPDLHDPWYALRVCAAEPGRIRAAGGLTVGGLPGLRMLGRAGTIVIPGWRDPAETPPRELLDALVRAHRRGARVVSVCTGAFVLAAAGLLDGRRATTHWMHSGTLAERYPRIRVTPDVLFVDEGDVITSAGSAAGIDACLHLVRKDFGADVASHVARRLVVPPLREGGQSQYAVPGSRPESSAPLGAVLEWALQHLAEPLPVERLAAAASMSPRTFARRFRATTGTTPHRWLTHQRVVAAQRLLETTRLGVDEVARAVGLVSAVNLRQHFARELRVSPSAYRRTFSASP